MKDLIAERDKKEKMLRSVIKRWNVHYMTQQEAEEEEKRKLGKSQNKSVPESEENEFDTETAMADMDPEQARMAQEIIDRLNSEAMEDEAKKQKEIEEAKVMSDYEDSDSYNEATNAYSGEYGKGTVDEENKDQIEKILAERGDRVRDAIKSVSGESD